MATTATKVMVAVEQLDRFDSVVKALTGMEAARGTDVVVLHVQAYERYGGPSFVLEELSDANFVAELAVSMLSMEGIKARGWVVSSLYDKRADAIAAAADRLGADLVVLADARPRRLAWLRKPLIERLRATATCPILVVDADQTAPAATAPAPALEHSTSS